MELNEVYELLDKRKIVASMIGTLSDAECYAWSDKGIDKIYEKWKSQKSVPVWGNLSLLQLFSQHPNYIPEKGMIVKKMETERNIDKPTIEACLAQLMRKFKEILVPGNVQYTPLEILAFIDKCNEAIANTAWDTDRYNGICRSEWRERLKYWTTYRNKINENMVVVDGQFVTSESYAKWCAGCKCLQTFYGNIDSMIKTDHGMEIGGDLAYTAISYCKECRARRNSQLHKIVRQICEWAGLDTLEWRTENGKSCFENIMAQLSDACIPKVFEQLLVVSLNPNDYYRASYGYHWTSCMNTDKNYKRHSSSEGMNGDGCTQAGTESYMLDSHTVIAYTLPATYDGDDYDVEDKIMRQLYHVGDQFVVCGRIYPQANDSSDKHNQLYDQWRHAIEIIIDECLGIDVDPTSRWTHSSSRNRKRSVARNDAGAVHYSDYDCNYCDYAGIAYVTNATLSPIYIGHAPICPKCGDVHGRSENINCDYCDIFDSDDDDYCRCESCDCRIYRNDVCWVGDSTYCSDCAQYCDYYEEYFRVEDMYGHVTGYGDISMSAFDSGPFMECCHCETAFCTEGSDAIRTTDGCWYCCSACATNDGYHCCSISGEWELCDGTCDKCERYR